MNAAITAPPFLDPLTDFGFKYLFGAETNKGFLISFLNAVFKGEKKIIAIEYGATESAGNLQKLKKVFFDVTCTADNGKKFIIEMQQKKQEYFRDRCIFYLSRSINEQVSMGKRWQRPLKEIYLIALLNFKLTDSEPDSYLQNIALINKDTGKAFYNQLGFKFFELPCFNKKEEELETDLDKWLYTLKNMSTLTKVPLSFMDGVFFEFLQEAKLNKMSKIDREIYASNFKTYNDHENTISYARKEGKIEGKAEGQIEGATKTRLLIARNLKQLGFPIDQIHKITKLPMTQIDSME
ncbi:Rpn family recombination-promoting nuclease/putative transposase [Pedobacter gandavensis]|uniref:Rpn family recombination-promoting nuclease/putative transposase n=1 Tax=Pedobacter gandavensis TaxID=2679963 RepID=A0ABR6EUE5_9SPHI|nr:Rpn family recombination-promoting nuclease/putative transposase [Pedobacter gandavensis]MBB2148892.1 Rpn family recombination-promoting nuclease/putative transposase [Pedobacter gandavensis]